MEHTILLLEDDTDLIDGLTYSLSREGYIVDVAQTVKTAYACLETREYSLLLLDVTLPDGNGVDVCRFVRERGSRTPIIFLTAMDEEVHVIQGLTAVRTTISQSLLSSGNCAPEYVRSLGGAGVVM